MTVAAVQATPTTNEKFNRLNSAMTAKSGPGYEMVIVVRGNTLVAFARRAPMPMQHDRGERNFIAASLADGLDDALTKMLQQLGV